MSNIFTCYRCRQVFEGGQSEEAAWAEYRRNFPSAPKEEAEVICQSCFDALKAWAKKKGLELDG